MLSENIIKRITNTKYEHNKSLFARDTKLNRDEIVRIISGKIKNPGIYTVVKIANALHCSVDDLLGNIYARRDKLHGDQVPFEEPLFLNSIRYISNYIDRHGLKDKTTAGRVLVALDIIYSFYCEKGDTEPEEDIAELLCKHSL